MLFLEQVAIFLLTAVLIVPVFQRLKLGAVLGYLVAGMLIGPWGLKLIGEVGATLHFAEFGVVLLLFLIGLELEPRRLWVMRQSVFGLGGAQVLATGIVLAAVAWGFGLGWGAALVAGLGLAMSSTAMILTSLAERGQLAARHGRQAFAVLLFQDLSVIPLLALLPLLSDESAGIAGGWLAAAKGLGVIAAVIAASRLVIRPALKAIAKEGGQEVFTAAALLLVVGASLAMSWIGLSMPLGAFLAGVLLADSEFRHELQADIEPFKGLLLGLFFMAVGMGANLGVFAHRPLTILGLAVLLGTIKFGVMYGIARVGGNERDSAWRLALALAPGGEFAFVLFALAAGLGVLSGDMTELLVLAVTVSMLLAPLAFAIQDRVIDPWVKNRSEPEYDAIDEPANPVVIAGYGRVGQVISRLLRMAGIPFTALESSFQQVDFVRRYGGKVYYGDASRLELLHAAKTGEAKLFVLAIDDVDKSVQTAEVVRRHFPDLPIIARARNRTHYFQLRNLGVRNIFRETFPASVDMARLALLTLGMSAATTEQAVALFRQHDEEQLDAQYAVRQDEARLIQSTREAADQLRELFETDVVAASPTLQRRRRAQAGGDAGARG
jgi:glutathione-regulated potassium-efflux system ancillary protein KefC/glutathione-regulated potassium-efflux system protein KefB